MRGFWAYRDLQDIAALYRTAVGSAAGAGEDQPGALLEHSVTLAKAHRFGQLAPVLGRVGRALLGEARTAALAVRLLNLQSFALKIVGDWDQAEALFREVTNLPPDTPGLSAADFAYDRARALLGIGEFKSFRGEYEASLRYSEQAAAAAADAQSPSLVAMCLGQQAGIHSRTGDQQRARALLNEALPMVEGDDETSRFVQAHIYLGLGLFDFREGHLAEAEDQMLRALSVWREDELPVERGDVLRYLGVIRGARGQYADAMASHMAALRIFRDAGYSYGQARVYNSIGRTFLQLTRLEEAIFYMEKGVRVCRELQADAELATIYGKIGNAYMLCEDYGRAVHYLQRDLELSNRFKNYYALGYTHRNLGRCYTQGGNLEDGIQHLNESLGLFQFVEDSANTGRVYLDLCQANTERGQLQQARQMGGKALHLLESHRLVPEAAYAHIVLGGIERRLGNLEESAQHLAEAMKVLEGSGSSSRLAEGYYELGQLAADRGDREVAFAYLEKALAIAKELGLKKHATRCFAVMESINDLDLLQLLTRDVADRAKVEVPS